MTVNKTKSTIDTKTEQLDRMAARIVKVLENDTLNKYFQDAVFAVAEQAIFNGDDDETRAEFIQHKFTRVLRNSNPQYVGAVIQSLIALMEEFGDKDNYTPIPAQPKESSESAEIENVASAISGLLNNPNVPQKIRDALDNALCDTKDTDTSEIEAWWKSPDYIAMTLRGHKKAEAA